jgi:predicted amidophosphoribosyltransferase
MKFLFTKNIPLFEKDLYCSICFDLLKDAKIVCTSCVEKLAHFEWNMCTRCARPDCHLSCDALSEFETLKSLYLFNPFFSLLLKEAKDGYDLFFRDLLFKIVEKASKAYFSSFIEERPDKTLLILGAALRKERFYKSDWHPLFLMKEVWQKTLEEKGLPPLSSPFIVPYKNDFHKKQAFTAKSERLSQEAQAIIFPHLSKSLLGEDHVEVLLVDDVLTTGQTILETLKAFKSKTNIPMKAHYFSLFRTPHSPKSSS